jgi:MoxR-like ATPase
VRAAQAWALIHSHPGVTPEDVQAVLGSVVGHRLKPRSDDLKPHEVGELVLKAVAVP